MSSNIALVGCGAIARQYHLAALARRRHEFDKVWVIDPSGEALRIACSILEADQGSRLDDIRDHLDFVIVASPNRNHFTAAREALTRGAHVLIEKPFVIWPDDGHELVRLAAERHRIVAVNQTRRLFPYAQELRRRISSGEFGALRGVVHNEGSKLNWPFMSGAGFAKDAKRTGVIMDMGVHILDFYQFLLEPTWEFGSAMHDGFRGPEGLAELCLKANGAPVSIRLSRYQKQDNIATLEFENARVQINIFEPNAYSVMGKSSGVNRRFLIQSPSLDVKCVSDRILGNFLDATIGREDAVCEARSSLPVIDILDHIYNSARRYDENSGVV